MTSYKNIFIIQNKKKVIDIKKTTDKTLAFTFFETIFSILIISIFLNIAFVKYQNMKENQAILEAKLKINEAFFYSSLNALQNHSQQFIEFKNRKIIVLNKTQEPIKEFNLPKNLAYYFTNFNSINNSSINPNFTVSFTKNGNISESFSIYIINRKKQVKYRISFYGFDKSKFLRINNYKYISRKEIDLSELFEYHKSTNEDRPIFRSNWRKE